MAQSLIRGSTQILDGTIPLTKLVSGYSIPTANLAQGALFVQSNGTVPFTASQSMGGFSLTNVADAVASQDAVNLRTAQGLINGVALKRARVVSVSNVSLSGLSAIDGVTPVANDIVLLTAQTTGSQNGLWQVSSGSWVRPSTWAAASSQKSTIFFVEEGMTYHDTKWIVITDAITVDTTSETINQDLSGVTYTNGNGLSLTGSTFAVKNGNGIGFDGSQNVTLVLNGATLSNSGSGLKITPGTPAQIMVATTTTGEATFTTVTGDVTISSTGVTTVNASTFLKYAGVINNEIPGGSVNSSNTAFTLANTPISGSVLLYLNGQRLKPGSGNDYTISGSAITMLYAPQTGDQLLADYLK